MAEWWRHSTFYQIYMPSFKDGNGDGMGDFAGITTKLDYLKDLGIDGLWLTPYYPSPKVDNGYDISDYESIDSVYGTMDDFETFINEAHRRNIRVIADIVLNHTSSEHQWFEESRSARNHPKRDWYIWRDRPNNWESFFGGIAWEYDELTGQYYYHAFAKEQVDLNWANPEVKQAMFNVMKFWLEKGIDGFRLDVINFLKVHDQFQDNPFNEENQEQDHLYDKDQQGILAVIEEIAGFIHQYPDKFLVGEVGSEDLEILKQYSGLNKLDVVFNFNIGSIAQFEPTKLYKELLETEKTYDSFQIPTLFFSSHDMSRHISRFGNDEDRAKLIAALMLTAKGVPFIYFGDEIGMRDWITDDINKMKDVQGIMGYQLACKAGKSHEEALAIANEKSRDKSRTPMQWSRGDHAGFSDHKPWITIPQDANEVNVEDQQKDPESILNFYKKLLKMRKQYSCLTQGEYEYLNNDDGLLIFIRNNKAERILVMFNFTDSSKAVEIDDCFSCLLLSNKRKTFTGKEILANEVLIVKEETGK
jgi:trehalose-6-phosphate hydrolase